MLRRPRRLRINSATRNLVRETKLNIEDLIYPLFIVEGENIKREISSLPDVYHFSLDMLEEEIKEIKDLGIEHVILLVYHMTMRRMLVVVKRITRME